MSFEPKQEDTGISPIIEAKSLLSNGNEAGSFAILKEAADDGNVMACYDCGFMMIQGIGCKKKTVECGFELMYKGMKLEEQSSDMSWKSNGSASELFEPQSMNLSRLFSNTSMNVIQHFIFFLSFPCVFASLLESELTCRFKDMN